ncbi:hypothetical protein M409DRAFT_26521 [Zasmidium cellare ATCC 36951]|uniref:Cytochrome P450 n=1 Tax=Zasmidium cellare ATCC 36951 TaxID=1080233 RepID=A0A6A6C7Q7_ZASCE|nr:uncharacterized protein M409DRAFT_26521 [Zasmidium cellare ATCC 36951]KAF2163075.1 hypothetical protein M409DRAFT_26521 [Zasmidium cellare ATCC 36951]
MSQQARGKMAVDSLSHVAGALVILTICYFLAAHILRSYRSRNKLPLPPGPRGLPLIAKLPEVIAASKTGEQHLLFQRWAREYGDVYKIELSPFTQYMVSSDVAVKAIFDKFAATSSNRPHWIVSREHICNNWNVLLLNANTPRWKQQRKVTWANVGSVPKADAALPFLHYETLKFMHDVVNDPAIHESGPALWNAIMRYTYSNFATQMFGLDVPGSTDPAIHYIHETGVAQIFGTLPGSYIVDVLPFLDALPLFMKPWEKTGRARFRRDLEWSTEKLQRVQAMADRDAIQDSLLCKIIEDEKYLGFQTLEEGAYFCLMLTVGAADTSQISTWSFIEAMLEYPEVQVKARQEIEKIVDDRIPEFADYDRIPYVRCLVKETWRWRPPVGLGHPHVTTADIQYNGMRIPKGSHLHLNGYAIHQDPNRHPDPDRFWPERYAGDETSVMQSINASDVRDRDHFAFGAGRRICPGYNVAERSLAVAIMRILWAFEIKPSRDAKLPLNIGDWRGGFPGLAGPKMPVSMVPLSEKRVDLINLAFKDASSHRTKIEPLDPQRMPSSIENSQNEVMAQQQQQTNDLVFVTYTDAPTRAARTRAVKDLVRKQALKAYYSPQGSDRVEERRRESDALDKQSRKKHMNRFRVRRDQELGKGKEDEEKVKGDGDEGKAVDPILLSRRVYAFEPYISSLGPGAWELLEYFRNSFKLKSMSIHGDKEWFSFTMSENSMAQATLCLVSLNRDFAKGTAVSSVTLHHRAAAMEQLKNEIDGTRIVDRETVAGTVAILAIAEDMEGNFTNSSAHFDGMAQIAKACGGLRWFTGERSCMILKIIAWADLLHAAAWLSEPRLLGWFDNILDLNATAIAPQDTSARLGDPLFRLELERLTCPHLRGMMDILHHFPQPTAMKESPEAEQAHWKRLLHMTELMVKQLKTRIPFEGSIPALSRAFTSAAQLYVPAVLRQTPLPRDAATSLTEEIVSELAGHHIRADPAEGRSPRNLLILWTQVNLLAALGEVSEREALASDFQETLSAMEIYSEEDLLEQLSRIAWSAPSIDDELASLILPLQLT